MASGQTWTIKDIKLSLYAVVLESYSLTITQSRNLKRYWAIAGDNDHWQVSLISANSLNKRELHERRYLEAYLDLLNLQSC